MRLQTWALAVAALSLAAPLPASADFIGAYDVANWTTTLNGNPPGGGGSVNTAGAPASIQLNGGNSGCVSGPCTVDFTIASVGNGNVTFDWAYQTSDVDGPGFDLFGFLLNGVFTQLSNNAGGNAQSGSALFAVLTGDVFGFRLACTDCILGPATTEISNFSAPVPEPASLLLFGAGLAALAFNRRRSR
jgi:hypothetical protein